MILLLEAMLLECRINAEDAENFQPSPGTNNQDASTWRFWSKI